MCGRSVWKKTWSVKTFLDHLNALVNRDSKRNCIFSPAPSPPLHVPGCFSIPPASPFSPNFLRVLQRNDECLRASRTELQFISSDLVDLICIKESNLNSSSFFRIPGFSALQSDRSHSRSGILSLEATHAGGVIIFIMQELSFSELSTSSLLRFTPTLIM